MQMQSNSRALLNDHWLLAGLAVEQRDALIAVGRELGFLAGEEIFCEGDAADGLYLITAGSVRVATRTDGTETVLALITANDVLGEMGIVDELPRSATATAHTMCSAYWLPTEPFLDMLERSPALAIRLLVLLARRLRASNTRTAELAARLDRSDSTQSLAD